MYVCVWVSVCLCVPSGMLTESCSVTEGPGVIGSDPGSPGDGSMEEEEPEGSVLRWRSSEKTRQLIRIKNQLHSGTINQDRFRSEQPTHLCHHSVPQVRGYGGRNPGHSIEHKQIKNWRDHHHTKLNLNDLHVETGLLQKLAGFNIMIIIYNNVFSYQN